ncbi:hypothetical protein [Streptomyces sp. SID1121]|uniref:hypothetical protein n=1 Tax=Streptomyces sp. SID1121 TaxID=3425888 RepID=UPI0040561142
MTLIEDELGRQLPADYHKLMEVYGPGCFDEFMWLYGNFPENGNLDIRHRTQKARRVFSRSASVNLNAMLDGLGATRQDVISWGGTDNGDLCIWVAVGSPDRWPIIVVDVREDIYLKFGGGVSDFLLAFLRKDMASDIFPDDFPSKNPEFSKNPYDPFDAGGIE